MIQMSKKVLITATELNLVQFWVYHIENLLKNGYSVDIVCSHVGGKLSELKNALPTFAGTIKLTVVDLKRSPLSPHNIHGFIQMNDYLKKNKYDYIITNEPVMGMVTRFAACRQRKNGAKVIYFAHGFHFWKGAPALNWILFFPMEKLASFFTDTIVTMNREDFSLAQKRFTNANIKYIHGIGIETGKFLFSEDIRNKKRKELGLTESNVMVFSANELTERKNVIFALEIINRLIEKGHKNIKYFVRGQGPLENKMREYIERKNISDNVFLLGYGKDIFEMNCAADVFLFTSKQEGLPVAVMEAMSCGVPCVVSNIRGVTDLIKNGIGGYVCKLGETDSFASAIEKIIDSVDKTELTAENSKILKPYGRKDVFSDILKILREEP